MTYNMYDITTNIIFLSFYRTFTKIDHIIGHKRNPDISSSKSTVFAKSIKLKPTKIR